MSDRYARLKQQRRLTRVVLIMRRVMLLVDALLGAKR